MKRSTQIVAIVGIVAVLSMVLYTESTTNTTFSSQSWDNLFGDARGGVSGKTNDQQITYECAGGVSLAFLNRDRVEPVECDFYLDHDGLTRTYRVHVPSNYDKKTKTPVVIYFHGSWGGEKSAAQDNMDDTADKFGFILVAPVGTGETRLGQVRASWNGGEWVGGQCCGTADDIGFISRMIDQLQKDFSVDEKRVFATGISNGGLMTNRVGCELSEKIAAIATVAPAAIPSDCSPSRPLPVMDIHGTEDTFNPYDGSEPTSNLAKSVNYTRMGPSEVMGFWLALNDCDDTTERVYQNGDATCDKYSRCSGGIDVRFCRIENHGHAFPSGFESRLLGITPVSHDLSGDQIWEFFKNNPMDN